MAKRRMTTEDVQRLVASLSPAQLARLQSLTPNAPSMRYARSPQWQAFARSLERRFPEWAKLREPGTSAVGALYGTLRSLANPAHEAIWKQAFGLPKDATRQQMIALVAREIPELGATPAAFERTLSTVATMEGIEKLGLRRFAHDIDQQRREGRTWDGSEKSRSDADRKRIAEGEQRRAMLARAAAESAARTPPAKRGPPGRDWARPHNSRMAELQAQYAAHSGRRAEYDPASPGFKQWQREHTDDAEQIAGRHEEIRASVEATERNAAAYESSLRETAADAEAAAEEWERSQHGDE